MRTLEVWQRRIVVDSVGIDCASALQLDRFPAQRLAPWAHRTGWVPYCATVAASLHQKPLFGDTLVEEIEVAVAGWRGEH